MNWMAGLLTLGSSYCPHLPIPLGDEIVVICGVRPRSQRRVRTGFSPVSLLCPQWGTIKLHDYFLFCNYSGFLGCRLKAISFFALTGQTGNVTPLKNRTRFLESGDTRSDSHVRTLISQSLNAYSLSTSAVTLILYNGLAVNRVKFFAPPMLKAEIIPHASSKQQVGIVWPFVI